MRTERRREPRHPFIARAGIIDEKENARTSSRVSNLSRHGCYVEISNPFPGRGSRSSSRFIRRRGLLEAHGTVAHIEPKRGMGLTFGEMPSYFAGVFGKVGQSRRTGGNAFDSVWFTVCVFARAIEATRRGGLQLGLRWRRVAMGDSWLAMLALVGRRHTAT